jgi:hypothetical protein
MALLLGSDVRIVLDGVVLWWYCRKKLGLGTLNLTKFCHCWLWTQVEFSRTNFKRFKLWI